MVQVNEIYSPLYLATSGMVLGLPGGNIGGFLCSVTGTLKLSFGADGSGSTIVDTMPVTAGVFLPLPFTFGPSEGVYATLAGGAKGTFAVNAAA